MSDGFNQIGIRCGATSAATAGLLCVAWLCTLASCGGAERPMGPAAPDPDSSFFDDDGPSTRLLPASIERGQRVYRAACAPCHGDSGAGDGYAGSDFRPLPRDFTRGNFRYRSTPSGSLPTDADLRRTISHGLPGSAMPAWGRRLEPQQIADVIARIKAYGRRFADEKPQPEVAIAPPVAATPTSISRGREVWVTLKCARCHGARGRGDGVAATDDMRDDRGHIILPRDFTRGVYAAGGDKRTLYRTFITGLDGTPMPSHAGSATSAELMDLVNYTLSLEGKRNILDWLGERPRWHEPGEHRERGR